MQQLLRCSHHHSRELVSLFGHDLPDCMSHIQLIAILEKYYYVDRLHWDFFNPESWGVSGLHDGGFRFRFRGSHACTLSILKLVVCYSHYILKLLQPRGNHMAIAVLLPYLRLVRPHWFEKR